MKSSNPNNNLEPPSPPPQNNSTSPATWRRNASQRGLPSGNGNRCAGHGLYSAKAVDSALWRYASKIISDPAILANAFKVYGERLKSANSPTRAKLKAAKKRRASTERKLARLLDLYLDEGISKTQYATRKKALDILLEQYSEDVAVLSQELKQSTKPEEHMVSITQFTEAATTELRHSTGIDHRREMIRRLGLRVELSQDRKNRYADAVFTSPDLCGIKDTPYGARRTTSDRNAKR